MKKVFMLSLALGTFFCLSTSSWGKSFSIDPGSPSNSPGITAADILTAGPIGGPPIRWFSAPALGLLPGFDNINALHLGPFMDGDAYFSVDPGSVGIPGLPPDVASEAALSQAAGDIYVGWFGPQPNSLLVNQDALGLLPAIPPGVPAAGPIDNLNALDMDHPSIVDRDLDHIPDAPVFFSLGPHSATLPLIGAGPEDILKSVGGALPVVAFSGAFFGLGTYGPGDDIDALVLGPVQDAFFSLAPGSPTLAGPDGIPGTPDDFSPADILFSPGWSVFPSADDGFPAAYAGLSFTDNIDAFSDSPVPVPGAVWLLGSGLLGLVGFRRKFKK